MDIIIVSSHDAVTGLVDEDSWCDKYNPCSWYCCCCCFEACCKGCCWSYCPRAYSALYTPAQIFLEEMLQYPFVLGRDNIRGVLELRNVKASFKAAKVTLELIGQQLVDIGWNHTTGCVDGKLDVAVAAEYENKFCSFKWEIAEELQCVVGESKALYFDIDLRDCDGQEWPSGVSDLGRFLARAEVTWELHATIHAAGCRLSLSEAYPVDIQALREPIGGEVQDIPDIHHEFKVSTMMGSSKGSILMGVESVRVENGGPVSAASKIFATMKWRSTASGKCQGQLVIIRRSHFEASYSDGKFKSGTARVDSDRCAAESVLVDFTSAEGSTEIVMDLPIALCPDNQGSHISWTYYWGLRRWEEGCVSDEYIHTIHALHVHTSKKLPAIVTDLQCELAKSVTSQLTKPALIGNGTKPAKVAKPAQVAMEPTLTPEVGPTSAFRRMSTHALDPESSLAKLLDELTEAKPEVWQALRAYLSPKAKERLRRHLKLSANLQSKVDNL